MDKHLITRRLYLLFFVFLFFITAPLVVFFAKGYRFDREGGVVVYSGAITVKSNPEKIDIYIDGELQKKNALSMINSSYTINGVRPDRYDLKISKDGYTDWNKKISVHSGIATEFWNILLVPDENHRAKETIESPSIDKFFLSPRRENEVILLIKKDDSLELSAIDPTRDSNQLLATVQNYSFDDQQNENIEWNSNNEKILIPVRDQDEKKDYLIQTISDTSDTSPIKLSSMIKEDIHQARWMFDKNENLIVLTDKKNLYSVNLKTTDEPTLLAEKVSGFDFAGDNIYLIKSDKNLIYQIKNANKDSLKKLTELSIGQELDKDQFFKINAYDEHRIAITTPTGDLFVYNEEIEIAEVYLQKVQTNVKGVEFSNDGKKLLYWTSNEIYVEMLRNWEVQPKRNKSDRIFITRFSSPVKNVQWMDDYEHIIFSIGETIKISEIDIRDRVNLIDAQTSNKELLGNEMFYNKRNQRVYFEEELNEKNQISFSLIKEKQSLLGL